MVRRAAIVAVLLLLHAARAMAGMAGGHGDDRTTYSQALADVRAAAATAPAPGAPPAATAAPAAPAGSTLVSFTIPATTLVRVAPDGTAVAAATNTGRPPAPTDAFVVVASDGARTPAGETIAAAVVAWAPSGAWAPGVWRSL